MSRGFVSLLAVACLAAVSACGSPAGHTSTDTTASPDVLADTPAPDDGGAATDAVTDAKETVAYYDAGHPPDVKKTDVAKPPPPVGPPTCDFPSAWGVDGKGAVQKVSKLKVTDTMVKANVGGAEKDVLDGCDLDGDGVPNNVLGKVGTLYKDLNKTLNDKVLDGTLVLMLEPVTWATDGSPLQIHWLRGDLHPSNAKCDVQSESADCNYTVAKSSYVGAQGPCQNQTTIAAAVTVDQLVGTIPKLVVDVPVVGINLKLQVLNVQVTGTVTGEKSWHAMTGGRLCGVLLKSDFVAIVDNGRTLVDSILKPDIDCDGDGINDCVSVSFDFETVAGHVSGMTP